MDSELSRKIQQNMYPYQELMSRYKCAIMEIETKFNVLNEQFSIQHNRNPIESIKSRLKSLNSILGKLKRKQLPFSVDVIEENLNDIAGVRVICSFVQDIYVLANSLLQQDDIKLVKVKDYIQHPKSGGYRSLHLIVEVPIFLLNQKRPMKVEIQLRTIAMDFWASLEHTLQYKKNLSQFETDLIAKELKDCADKSAALDIQMENLKNKILQESNFIQTLPSP
ncbi:MAG: GTP pyrophosphokinase family protein [Spirochaetaceae bacterium]|nr:GTP pyrophosphokinase family protein [Spirochaetaceae bacterium]